MKYILMLILALGLLSCDDENNMTSEPQSLPFANKVWYLAEIGGEQQELTDDNYISWQLNEGVGFNSYRINEKQTFTESDGSEEVFDLIDDIGTWEQIEENVFELNSDNQQPRINGRSINDKTLYIISQTDQELIADLEAYWLFRFDGTTEENGGVYKVRARFVSERN